MVYLRFVGSLVDMWALVHKPSDVHTHTHLNSQTSKSWTPSLYLCITAKAQCSMTDKVWLARLSELKVASYCSQQHLNCQIFLINASLSQVLWKHSLTQGIQKTQWPQSASHKHPHNKSKTRSHSVTRRLGSEEIMRVDCSPAFVRRGVCRKTAEAGWLTLISQTLLATAWGNCAQTTSH